MYHHVPNRLMELHVKPGCVISAAGLGSACKRIIFK